mmetsp:Transcript_2648/g.3611  ORF Transcript_2648/g.3611 Transcript_2648/m.3611 type:complete len:891 (-) Transcript_2648:202-2874(-)
MSEYLISKHMAVLETSDVSEEENRTAKKTVAEILRLVGFIQSLEDELNMFGNTLETVATAKDIECESDDGLSAEIAHLSNPVVLATSSLLTKQGDFPSTMNGSAYANLSLSADSKSPPRQPINATNTPSRSIQTPSLLLETPDSRLDSFLDVISERRQALRAEAERRSPFPSPPPTHISWYQDTLATPTELFPSDQRRHLQDNSITSNTTDIDSTPNHDTNVSREVYFFSAFPTNEVDTDGVSPASTGSGSGGKTLQDFMSSSSSDFTVEKLRRNWDLEDEEEEELLDPEETADAASVIISSPAPEAGPQEPDPRLEGDVSSWSSGGRLTSAGLRRTYVGLFASRARWDNFNGSLVRVEGDTDRDREGSLFCALVVEVAVRPDVRLSRLMAAVGAVCTGRSALQYALLQRSHGEITRQKGLSGAVEWEVVDVQVCVSREIRQRVLLFQFLKSAPVGPNLSLSGRLFGQLAGSPTAVLQRLEDCPRTGRFISLIKAELAQQALSLSCLYRAPLKSVCSLPSTATHPNLALTLTSGLDSQLLAQLHSLCRENMLARLRAQHEAIQRELEVQDSCCGLLRAALLPIYKEHGVQMPSFAEARKMFASLSASGRAESSPPPTPLSPATRVTSLYQEQLAGLAGQLNGMTFCLVMLDCCLTQLQDSCEQQLQQRLAQRRREVDPLLRDLATYRLAMLAVLAHSPLAQGSVLTESFLGQFEAVLPPTHPPEPGRPRAATHVDSAAVDASSSRRRSSSVSLWLLQRPPYYPNPNFNPSFQRVVLFYCRCWAHQIDHGSNSNLLGTVYVTPAYLCVSSGLLDPQRKRFLLSELSSCEWVNSSHTATNSTNADGKCVQCVFADVTLRLTPLLADCSQLHAVLLAAKELTDGGRWSSFSGL